MATFSTAARNQIADAHGVNGGANWFSLHSDDPGTTGANEVASCPRKQDSYPAAVGGETTSVGRVHDVPANATIRYFGRWSAQTGGTFHSGGALPGQETYGANGGQYAHSHKITAPTS